MTDPPLYCGANQVECDRKILMSMILDALTRAEHERQLEKQPDLKFVTPVKPQKKTPNNIWLWVGLIVVVNALILFLVIRILSVDIENEIEMPSTNADTPIIQQPNYQQVSQLQPLVQETVEMVNNEMPESTLQQSQQMENAMLKEVRPLAMEVNNKQSPGVDRPLVYESKKSNVKPVYSTPKPIIETNLKHTSSKGMVSFSSIELSDEESTPILNKPKLLIEGVSNNTSFSSVPNVGDRITDGGHLVEAITPAGVVVDYGSGRALLPPN